MVIDRGAFLSGDYLTVFEEIVEVKEAAGDAHLKVILETGELETYDNVRRASVLAMAAGADFIKTSTGKVTPAATLPVTLVMLEAIRDFERSTGRQVGMKPAGGIRTAKEAIQYLVVLYETLGPRWMSPDWFRFGASSLLNDVLMQIEFQRTGPLPGPGPLHARLTDCPPVEPVAGRPSRDPVRRLLAGRAPHVPDPRHRHRGPPVRRAARRPVARGDRGIPVAPRRRAAPKRTPSSPRPLTIPTA